MKIPKPSLTPALIWLFICTALLCIPGSAFPKENWLEKIWFDKWVHIGMFLSLVVIWCWWQTKGHSQKKSFIIITVIAILYGVVMEFVQRDLVPNRSFDPFDIIADAAGSLIGYIVSIKYLLNRKYE